ncbi:MAG: helix-turn-helix domain-containing protein [Cyclobacteriaceae bacterium]
MELIAISLNDFKALEKKVDEIKLLVIEKQSNGTDRLIPNADFIREYGISKETAKKWRQQNYLPFIKIGRKIFYDEKDVIAAFRNHSFSKFRSKHMKKPITVNDDT